MPASSDHLQPDETLSPGEALSSPSGRYTLTYQTDGNLVLYRRPSATLWEAMWGSGTDGRPGDVCVMQTDGNLVLYDVANRPIWASSTDGNPGSSLILRDSGVGVVLRPDGTAAWATWLQSGGIFCPSRQWTQVDYHWGVWPYPRAYWSMTIGLPVTVQWRWYSTGIPPYWKGEFVTQAKIFFPPSLYTRLEFNPSIDTEFHHANEIPRDRSNVHDVMNDPSPW